MSASDDWDVGLKLLFKERPQDYTSWCVPGAQYQGSMSGHLPGRKIDMDTLHEILLDGESDLLHAEFQSYRDPNMERRMWEYNVRATLYYNRPVISVVIYLKKERKLPRSPYIWKLRSGREIHRFQFVVIKLWEEKAETLKQLGLVGLLPLLVLAQDGQRPEVVEDAITGIQSRGGRSASELLSLTYLIASLVFKKKAEKEWLDRRFAAMRDILQETWAYKKIKREGLEEGRREGRQEGRQEGLQQGLQKGRQEALHEALQGDRQAVLEVVQGRFPDLTRLAQDSVDTIIDLGTLQRVLVEISLAQTEEVAKQVLLKKGKVKN
jgi:predicted transposase YdaD